MKMTCSPVEERSNAVLTFAQALVPQALAASRALSLPTKAGRWERPRRGSAPLWPALAGHKRENAAMLLLWLSGLAALGDCLRALF